MRFSARADGADIRVCDVTISAEELSLALMDGRHRKSPTLIHCQSLLTFA
jgi:hypothetical protein